MSLDLDMGKYVVFVWASYGLSALVIAGLVADSLARARRWRREAERRAPSAEDDAK